MTIMTALAPCTQKPTRSEKGVRVLRVHRLVPLDTIGRSRDETHMLSPSPLALADDLPELATIERAAAALFPERVLPAALRDETVPRALLEAGIRAGLLFVARDEKSAPVGFALVKPIEDGALLVEMDVHPAHHRRGHGRFLLSHAKRATVERGFAWLGLTTYATLPWNAPFYTREGFRALATGDEPRAITRMIDEEIARGLRERVAMVWDAK
jgi:GNAT superfamily N-acetyltransferase